MSAASAAEVAAQDGLDNLCCITDVNGLGQSRPTMWQHDLEQFARRFDFGPEPDSIAYLMRHGAKVSEMQAQMRERQAGESYFNAWKSIVYMARTCTSILFVQWFR